MFDNINILKRFISLIFLFVFILNYPQGDGGGRALLKVGYMMDLKGKTNSSYTYTLICNNQKSLYCDPNAIAFYSAGMQGTFPNTAIPKSRSSVYKDGDKVTVTMPIDLQFFSYLEPELKWEIVPEQKKRILTYDVFLARTVTDTGKEFFAWFAPEITIPDGPFRFKGLAGLVLEVYNTDRSIHIYTTEISKSNDEIVPLRYFKVYSVTKHQFLEKRNSFLDDPEPLGGSFIIRDKKEMKKKTEGIDRDLLLD